MDSPFKNDNFLYGVNAIITSDREKCYANSTQVKKE